MPLRTLFLLVSVINVQYVHVWRVYGVYRVVYTVGREACWARYTPTMLGRHAGLGIPPYIPGWYGGLCTSWYMPGGMVGYVPSWYIPGYTSLGTPPSHPAVHAALLHGERETVLPR